VRITEDGGDHVGRLTAALSTRDIRERGAWFAREFRENKMAEPETVPAVYRQLHELGLRLHAAAKEFDPSREDGRRSSVITSIGTGIFSLGCGGTLTRLREFSETGKWSGLLHLVIELVRNWCLHRLPSECGAPIQK
jgi:hypothetical protein